MSDSPRRLRLYLCHAEPDKVAVGELYRQLENDGIEVWFNEEDLDVGSTKVQAITTAIREVDIIAVCLSQKGLASEGYFHKELTLALDKAELQPEGKITILPLRLDNCKVPFRLDGLVSLDLFNQGGYERLLKSLRRIAQRHQLETAPATTLPTNPANFTLPLASAAAPQESATPKMLGFAERSGIVERLLNCPTLSSPSSRDTIFQNLPGSIARSVARNPQPTIELTNLLTICLIQPQGLQSLLEVVGFFEQGSLPFTELQRYVKQIF